MRIAIDARELAGRRTGVGRYLQEILRAWDQLPAAADHRFLLCAPEPIDHGLTRLPVDVVTGPRRGTAWEQLTLPSLVRDCDLLFAPGYSGPVSCPIPMVVTVHDVSFAAHPEWFSWREGLRRRLLTRAAAQRAVRVLTVSDFSKREIVRLLRVPQEKVEVIYSGITSIGLASRRNGSGADATILYVGSVLNRRHVPELIAGFARLHRRHPGTRLVIAGDNRTQPSIDLAAAARREGVVDAVDIREYVTDEALAALYAQASALAFLSDYEGFGFTPLEALVAGVPPVVLDTPVAREIYGPAAAFVARPDPDAIAGTLEQVLFGSEGARIMTAAPAVLERYTWQESAHRTLQVLLSSAS